MIERAIGDILKDRDRKRSLRKEATQMRVTESSMSLFKKSQHILENYGQSVGDRITYLQTPPLPMVVPTERGKEKVKVTLSEMPTTEFNWHDHIGLSCVRERGGFEYLFDYHPTQAYLSGRTRKQLVTESEFSEAKNILEQLEEKLESRVEPAKQQSALSLNSSML